MTKHAASVFMFFVIFFKQATLSTNPPFFLKILPIFQKEGEFPPCFLGSGIDTACARVKIKRSILLSSDLVIREFGIAMGLEREINETCHTLGLRLLTTL